MRKPIILCIAMLALVSCADRQSGTGDIIKTTFQTAWEWRPTIDNRADAVMVYGVGGNPSDGTRTPGFKERVRSWRDRGYITQFMTGIAWGEYQDYFTGQWDGEWHLDEGQVTARGDTIWHGRLVPYIVPSDNFLKYMKEKHVRSVVDAGIEALFMEEPEFWARAGYSEAFKKEWEAYYGFPWRSQHESPENTYLSNKLKYHLYYRALDEVFSFAKEYGRSKGMDVKCYVATHSLLNYSQWQIVSPEASLASLPCVDGYIAQVWTGTSREPNYFNGSMRERVFETAFLEYGSMASMTAPTGREMFFLTDPIEDMPRDWADYKRNYEATFTAQLLYPEIAHYEVMPWPERVYEGLYRVSPDSDERSGIPRCYATQMQVMINSLNKMPLSDTRPSGTEGISVLMANSLMFQRYPLHEDYDDPQLSNFYGLTLPLLKRGVPVRIVHIENLGYKQALAETKILLMTYSNMKPMNSEAHVRIAKWVKKGGVLVYVCNDTDPFQAVQEWWNSGDNSYAVPVDHLFSLMGIPAGAPEGEYSYGKGKLCVVRSDPKEFVLSEGGDIRFLALLENLIDLTYKNNFHIKRGVYELAAVMEESVSNEPFVLTEPLIDLFDPDLPVLSEAVVFPGNCGFFVNLARVSHDNPKVLAAASREYDEEVTKNSYSFTAKGPVGTVNVARVLLPSCPCKVIVDGENVYNPVSWDWESFTYLLNFENSTDGVRVEFSWE